MIITVDNNANQCVQDGRLPDAMQPACADVEEEEEEGQGSDDANTNDPEPSPAALELPIIDPSQRVEVSKNLAGM